MGKIRYFLVFFYFIIYFQILIKRAFKIIERDDKTWTTIEESSFENIMTKK